MKPSGLVWFLHELLSLAILVTSIQNNRNGEYGDSFALMLQVYECRVLSGDIFRHRKRKNELAQKCGKDLTAEQIFGVTTYDAQADLQR